MILSQILALPLFFAMRHLHTRCCKKRKKTNRNATINAVVIAQIDFDVSFSLFRFVSPQNSYCAFLILIDIVRPQTKSHMPSTWSKNTIYLTQAITCCNLNFVLLIWYWYAVRTLVVMMLVSTYCFYLVCLTRRHRALGITHTHRLRSHGGTSHPNSDNFLLLVILAMS